MGESSGSEDCPPEALTLDQMMEKYPKEEVEKVIVYRDYFKERAVTIQKFTDQIQRGINAETCREGLRKLLQNTPSTPPVDPTEPTDLDPDVLWRIQYLKYLLRSDCCVDEDAANINAIIDAYRHRTLKVDSAQCTVWYAGKLVIPPLRHQDLKRQDYIDRVPEWREQYGFGHVFIEDVNPAYMKMCSVTLHPFNEFSQHVLSIRARLLGQTGFIVLDHILDDTGAAYLELFRDDDCALLGLTSAYPHWGSLITLSTANGLITRSSIELAVQLLIDGNPFGPVCLAIAIVSPGAGVIQRRCSGPFLRENLFTSTHPSGLLYVSDKKTGRMQLTLPLNRVHATLCTPTAVKAT